MWRAENIINDTIVYSEKDNQQNIKFNKKLQLSWKLTFVSLISHTLIHPLLASSPCVDFRLTNHLQINLQISPHSLPFSFHLSSNYVRNYFQKDLSKHHHTQHRSSSLQRNTFITP